jgi:cytochrome c oxidase assembly protein subunit 15
MRHQHAGLAIHDFPLAYDQVWPATDAQALLRYNQNRAEESEVTAFQIQLQMFHRLGGLLAAGAIMSTWVQALRTGGFQSLWGRMTSVWASLVLVQVLLGIFTILRNKPADVATAHVAVGALTLVTGCLLVLVSRRQERPAPVSAETGDISALAPATR